MLRRRRERPVYLVPREVKGKIPPHDLDAEGAVLSAVLLERDALDRVLEILRPEHFYSTANGRIYEAAVDLASTGTPIDITTIAGWLRNREWLGQVGGVSYLAQLVDQSPAVAHVEAHARTVADKWRVRQMIANAQRIAAEGYEDIGDTREWLESNAQSMQTIAESIQSKKQSSHIKDAMKAAWDEVHAGADVNTIRIRTGLDKIDDLTTGPQIGDVWIVAGRPGMGKTSAALSMALNMAAHEERAHFNPETHRDEMVMVPGVGVLIQSLEMPKEQMALRISVMEADVPLHRARQMRAGRGTMLPDDWPKIGQAGEWIGSLPIWIDDTPGLDLLQIRANVRAHKAICKRMALVERGPNGDRVESHPWELRVVIVDYLQLMKGSEAAQNREQEIAGITKGLKELAKEFGVAVIAVSQLNRAVENRSDKRPLMADLRESGSIEMDADTILLLYRDAYYRDVPPDRREVAEVNIAKQRNGPTDTVYVRFIPSTTKFCNLPPSMYPKDA